MLCFGLRGREARESISREATEEAIAVIPTRVEGDLDHVNRSGNVESSQVQDLFRR